MTHQNEILHWIKPRRIAYFWGKFMAYFFTARLLPNRKVAVMTFDESFFVYRGDVVVTYCVSQAWFHVGYYFIARTVRGRDHIIGELRWERLYLALVSYRLFYQRIFVFDMTYLI